MQQRRYYVTTRGQWPFRLASNRAMKNGQVMLYDLNYVGANFILFIKDISCFMAASEAANNLGGHF